MFDMPLEELSASILGKNVRLPPHHIFQSKNEKNQFLFQRDYYLGTQLQSFPDFSVCLGESHDSETPITAPNSVMILVEWKHPKIQKAWEMSNEYFPNVLAALRKSIQDNTDFIHHDALHALDDLDALDADAVQADLDTQIAMLKDELHAWSSIEHPCQHILNTLRKQSLITVSER